MPYSGLTELEAAQEEERLATYLSERVIGHASGRLEDECLYDRPSDKYFIGNLRSTYSEEDADPLSSRDLMSKLAPMAFGAEFLIQPNGNNIDLKVTARWSLYYRVFPTYNQQRDFLQRLHEEEHTERRVEMEKRRQHKQQKARLCIRFRKIPCQATGSIHISRTQDNSRNWTITEEDFASAIADEIRRAQRIVMKDPERFRTNRSDVDRRVSMPESALDSEEVYADFLKQLDEEIPVVWQWRVEAEMRRQDSDADMWMLGINLINESPMPYRSKTRENYLFDAELEITFSEDIVRPFTLELAPRGFRYERHLWGRGFNCSVEKEDSNSTGFRTTHVPMYRQMRFRVLTDPPARFADLAQDPVPVLENIRREMQNYMSQWDKAEEAYREYFGNEWKQRFADEFQRDRQQFLNEVNRFERGLDLIRNNPDVKLAFRLTNETFNRSDKEAWRLFQIVFLVTQVPGIAALADPDGSDSDEREKVDIIYFPTAGGKTEAYHAVLVFHCFFDRLRGKSAGVTAWIRFPLRLLTLQQTQRMADIIGMAELVRRDTHFVKDDRLNGNRVAGFAVGYFVGKGGSPNELVNPEDYPYARPEHRVTWSLAQDSNARQRWRRVIDCPYCRIAYDVKNTVQVDFDETQVRLIHRCTNPGCAFDDGHLPVYIVDNEIYRYLPSIIVGTIDKLAGVGNQRKLSQVFGQIDGVCRDHGYYSGKCNQKGCRDESKLGSFIPNGLSGPTLFLQDELHLLREGLGTFDGHYETFTQELLREFGYERPLKIIASSATIEAFKRQVEHLYGRLRDQARVFPGPGPYIDRSFYAETLEYPQRLFYGIIPYNKTIFNAILELLEYYHSEVQKLQRLTARHSNPYNGIINPGTVDWRQLIDNHVTSLTYFLATRDLASIHTDLDSHVNTELRRNGYRPLRIAELTGSTTTSNVSRILEGVEQKCPAPDSVSDAILATSMISHGVDVDRFNMMLFYGMPRQNAEYIQASSRVGRAHVANVFVCLHPARERDRSHYAYFKKYHEFLGQLVEPVAINRWSKFSVQRTVPGLFMGVLLQLIANKADIDNPNRYYMLDHVKQQINSGNLQPDDFIALLEKAYGVSSPSNRAEQDFQEEIRRHVRQFFDQIIGAQSQRKFVLDVLIPRPMRSLRDVDEAIEIELGDTGSSWANLG